MYVFMIDIIHIPAINSREYMKFIPALSYTSCKYDQLNQLINPLVEERNNKMSIQFNIFKF